MRNHTAQREIDISQFNNAIPGARILIVSNDEAIRNLHEAIFILDGYCVETTADGVDALGRLTAGDFDLLIIDRNLPGFSGEQLVIALRESGSRIPVVMIVGSLAKCPLSAQIANEVSAALPKPVRLADVRPAILTALNSVAPRRPSAV
jgi:CheY-like chemotaxis protein